MKGEKGQALPLALVALAIGAILVTPFARSVSVNSIASRTYSSSILQQYSSDAGVEDAIWDLTKGTLADQLTAPGDTVSYSLSGSVNEVVPNISVTRDKAIIASDDFESNDWSGGSGWVGDWYHQGAADIVKPGSPYEGEYHLRLKDNTGYVKRAVNLSFRPGDSLQFWAKADSFEGGEEAYCKVSSNGTDWTPPVHTWVDGDGEYHFYEIDLSPYTLSSRFWIAFEANMGGPDDYFYVDDLKVMRTLPGAVVGLPSDDFEGGWSGGSGWLDRWRNEGTSTITDDSPYQGSYHLSMRRGDSYVDRAADLSGQSGLHLQFWAKVKGFEADDEVHCLVSDVRPEHGSPGPYAMIWTIAHSDDTYHFYDIELPYTMSSEFWVAFDSAMDHRNDFFYVDHLTIVRAAGAVAYEIVSSAGDERTRADIVIEQGVVSIRAWQIGRQ